MNFDDNVGFGSNLMPPFGTLEVPLEEKKTVDIPPLTPNVQIWLKMNYSAAMGFRLEIKWLWDNYYRLKYWGKNKNGDEVIKTSIFAKIMFVDDKFKLECMNKDEVKWEFINKL